MRFKLDTYRDSAVVEIKTLDDLLPINDTVCRGVLKNCKNAKEIVPVWVDGLGYADCSVQWLRDRGCPAKFLKGKRPNDRIQKPRTNARKPSINRSKLKMDQRVATALENIQQKFDEMKKDEDYGNLGWFFWDLFFFWKKGTPERKLASKLWKSLSADEKDACEA
jgi:hypothetical protein